MKEYTFHIDPGHGWLAVPMQEILELGIAAEITHYSYLKDGVVYLEEDCDLATWMDAKRARGIEVNRDYLIKEQYKDVTPIRNYPSYRNPFQNREVA